MSQRAAGKSRDRDPIHTEFRELWEKSLRSGRIARDPGGSFTAPRAPRLGGQNFLLRKKPAGKSGSEGFLGKGTPLPKDPSNLRNRAPKGIQEYTGPGNAGVHRGISWDFGNPKTPGNSRFLAQESRSKGGLGSRFPPSQGFPTPPSHVSRDLTSSRLFSHIPLTESRTGPGFFQRKHGCKSAFPRFKREFA